MEKVEYHVWPRGIPLPQYNTSPALHGLSCKTLDAPSDCEPVRATSLALVLVIEPDQFSI